MAGLEIGIRGVHDALGLKRNSSRRKFDVIAVECKQSRSDYSNFFKNYNKRIRCVDFIYVMTQKGLIHPKELPSSDVGLIEVDIDNLQIIIDNSMPQNYYQIRGIKMITKAVRLKGTFPNDNYDYQQYYIEAIAKCNTKDLVIWNSPLEVLRRRR
jgi:hypothetical protein